MASRACFNRACSTLKERAVISDNVRVMRRMDDAGKRARYCATYLLMRRGLLLLRVAIYTSVKPPQVLFTETARTAKCQHHDRVVWPYIMAIETQPI